MNLREDCDAIVAQAIKRVQPREAIRRALQGRSFGRGRLVLIAAGKAAWQMADEAWHCLEGKLDCGIVITKYGHACGKIGSLAIHEAGHPVPDEAAFSATREALALTERLTAEDTVLFLLSGGGSALFEEPLVEPAELCAVTRRLLACAAEIGEFNTVRKRLSAVKGGRFAQHCAPARVLTVALSDVIGDRLDLIASGPTAPDLTTCAEAQLIAEKYQLELSHLAKECMRRETPKELANAEGLVVGSVRELCRAAADACRARGYEPRFLTDCLRCEAREAGSFLASVARSYQEVRHSVAFLAGGETAVHVHGAGRGGRNQELALAAAADIAGLRGTAVFSVGSDGTDGPTDAAGGFVTGETRGLLEEQGIHITDVLRQNDSYHALQCCGGLIVTGPTGTNVNDIAVVLIQR